MTTSTAKRKEYFIEQFAIAAFNQAFVKHVSTVLKRHVSQFMPPENTHRLRHGGDWHHPGVPEAVGGGLQKHTSEATIKFQDVIDHDVGAINRHVQKIAADMSAQFEKMMYSTVSTACDQSGNVIDAKVEGGALEGIAAMLEKIQFSADKDGNVNLPQIHLSPQAFQKLQQAEKSASPELLQRISDTRERKTAEAILEETRRKARFVRYGEDA